MFHFFGRGEADSKNDREQAVSDLKGTLRRSRDMLSQHELAASLQFRSEEAVEKRPWKEEPVLDQGPEKAWQASASYTFWSPRP